jgi:hypothetical protein
MKRDPTLAFLAGWLVPGLGHLMMGKPRKAMFFFASLASLHAAGYVLADFRWVRYEDNMFYWVGRWGSGLSWAATWLVESNPPRNAVPMEYYEVGLLYMCAAGLLNVILMLNLLGSPSPQPGSPAPEPENSAPPAAPQP